LIFYLGGFLAERRNMKKIGRHMKHLSGILAASIAATLMMTPEYVMAEELVIGNFSVEGLAGWEQKGFNGITEYSLFSENDTTVVQAKSEGTASGLIKKISFDPKKYRYLRWSWKVLHTIPGGNEKTKAGDDYAARIYVVFPGKYFWQTKAINYIWANQLNMETSLPNAYTSSAMMVAVQSGSNNIGQWHTEKRDLFIDYKNLFGSDPGPANAIAIMTDTDDTGENAMAWYGDITLSTDP
jgi:hypothetical protein